MPLIMRDCTGAIAFKIMPDAQFRFERLLNSDACVSRDNK
jgi:hypothetical protein